MWLMLSQVITNYIIVNFIINSRVRRYGTM